MIKKGAFLIGLIGLSLSSCIDHEVIPAPIPQVDLTCSFEGEIGGALIEFTENVDGYTCFPSIAKQTSLGVTDAQYLYAMTSQDFIRYIQIGLGSLTWNDPTGTDIPGLSPFNEFFSANDLPSYSDGGLNGFEATFHDTNGDDWSSRENSPNAQNVTFTGIDQESDASGDYSKFICTFNCYVYHDYPADPPNPAYTDSMLIQNAIYRGYFKR